MSATLVRSTVLVMLLAACGGSQTDHAAPGSIDEARGTVPRDAPAAGSVAEKSVAGFAATADATGPRAPGVRWSGAVGGIESAMIIRTGQASIEIDSLEPGIGAIRALADRIGGYVANTAIQSGRGQYRSASIEIRLPANQFDAAISGLAPIGKVEQVNVTAEDVGEEFTDLTARAANAHRLEQRLIELIATRTGKLSDVLEIERELSRVREEIERMEGRMRFLRSRAAISSLQITIHEPAPLVGDQGSGGVLRAAAKQAWRNFVGLVAAGITSLGIVVPVGLVLATLLVGVRRWRAA